MAIKCNHLSGVLINFSPSGLRKVDDDGRPSSIIHVLSLLSKKNRDGFHSGAKTPAKNKGT